MRRAQHQQGLGDQEAEAHLQQSREVAKELEKGSSYELTGAKLEKKEQLLLANNVLKLSSDLLKELDKRSHDILGKLHGFGD